MRRCATINNVGWHCAILSMLVYGVRFNDMGLAIRGFYPNRWHACFRLAVSELEYVLRIAVGIASDDCCRLIVTNILLFWVRPPQFYSC